METIKGFYILQHLSNIPDTRKEVKWNEWPRKNYSVNDLDHGDCSIEVMDKNQMFDYVADFLRKFGVLPLFSYPIKDGIIEIVSPEFIQWRKGRIDAKSNALEREKHYLD